MTPMLELYYREPANPRHEASLADQVRKLGGRQTFREADGARGSICLTYEFSEHTQAQQAARLLREQGEHVEGPVDYGA